MKFTFLFFCTAFCLLGADTKHLEMDYGDVMSMSIDSQWPEAEKVTRKAIVQRLSTLAFPPKGTPIGKGRFIKVRKEAIEGTEDDRLYQYQRERSTGYLIAVPSGQYNVTLKFAEIKRKNPGERVFDIFLQGKKIRENFDPFKEAGGLYKAIDISLKNVEVDRFFRLEFIQKSTRSTPAIAGIVIENETYSKKINCGDKEYKDYEADWSKSDYMDDPFSTGIIFDTELLRYTAAWTNGFAKLRGTSYDATHGTHPSIQGEQVWGSGYRPGWVIKDQPFTDPRRESLGHLSKNWAHYKGLYRHEEGNVFTYTVGNTLVLDNMSLLKLTGEKPTQAYVRTVQGDFKQHVWQLVCEFPAGDKAVDLSQKGFVRLTDDLLVAFKGLADYQLKLLSRKINNEEVQALYVQVPTGKQHFSTVLYRLTADDPEEEKRFLQAVNAYMLRNLQLLMNGGKTRWPQSITTQGKPGKDESMLTVDEITMPENNPWRSWMRPGAFDFFADGKSMAVSTWSGDVWIVSNLDDLNNLQWKRFAAGLFHPLGLKIVDGVIYVQCRDQISILHDLNKDGEADYYQNFNNDVIITENFHEFSFELHRDQQGNFYFVKGAPVVAGGEGFADIKEHHGCLFRVSPDGAKLEIIATGFRAPNGMGISPNGQLTVSDNEGNWVAATPINWIEEGGFYGVHETAQRSAVPEKRNNIICWIPHKVDNSAGGQVWIPQGQWGPLGGQLLHMSYGQARLFHVLQETIDGQIQGGVVDLKPFGGFDAGIMRGRFNSSDSSLYLCGLKGWQTKGVKDGGLYRVRYTEKKECRPVSLQAGSNGLKMIFSEPVDELSALDAGNYQLSRWVYEISDKYGSKHFKAPKGRHWQLESRWSPLPESELKAFEVKEFPDSKTRSDALKQLYSKYLGEEHLEINSITLSEDKKTVFLEIPQIIPVMQMRVLFEIKAATGEQVQADIHHTIHRLGKWRGKPGKAIMSTGLQQLSKGIVAKYTHLGQKQEDVLVQERAALFIPEKSPVTQFLDHGPFKAGFDGFIKVERNMKVEFFTEGRGQTVLSINGQVVSRTTTGQSKVAPVPLKKGFNKISIAYVAPASGEASFRLYWRSEGNFPKEPVPATVFYHEAGEVSVKAANLKRSGLNLMVQKRCFSCHDSGNAATLPELKASHISLDGVADRLQSSWVKEWIKDPQSMSPGAHMPQMLAALTKEQREKDANDLTAFLTQTPSKVTELKGNAAQGRSLYENLGCASCHTLTAVDSGKDLISLKNAAQKFVNGGLAAFIADPQKYHPQSAMPNFSLSEDQSLDLEVYIRSHSKPVPGLRVEGDALRGKQLFSQHSCVACHTHKAIQDTIKTVPLKKSSTACFVAPVAGKPVYQLSGEEQNALKAIIPHAEAALRHNHPAEYARRQLQNLKCYHCHTHDNLPSRWKSPHTLPQEQPPSLTHVGEKVVGPYLAKILAGQPEKMRPWQKAVMPSFKSQAAELAVGLNHLYGFSHQSEKKSAQDLAAPGSELIKQNGFACIVCHPAGELKALAPFGAPGPDLKLSGERLRHEYYMRWMLDPRRVEPTTHMTQFSSDYRTTGVKILEGDARKQFQAIWHYMQKLQEK